MRKCKDADRWLAVGLGNPGAEYAHTRHNAGFDALDIFTEKLSAGPQKNKFDSVFCEGKLGDTRVIAAKPQTYMNLSGRAVYALSSFYKIPVSRIIIISDDIAIPVGCVRIRRKGSAGGHNGLKDIFAALGTQEIIRIKVGVGDRADKREDLKNHVLSKIGECDAEEYGRALEKAAAAAEDIIENGIDHAMNKYSK